MLKEFIKNMIIIIKLIISRIVDKKGELSLGRRLYYLMALIFLIFGLMMMVFAVLYFIIAMILIFSR